MNLKWTISEDDHGLRVWFRVPGYKNAQSRRFPRGTPKHVIEGAIDGRIKELLARAAAVPERAKRGVTADVERYLALAQVQRMPTFKERKRHLERLAEHFGARDRLDITKQDIETVLGRWHVQQVPDCHQALLQRAG